MKKFIVICCVVAGMVLFASSAANASSYWMAPGDLANMAWVESSPNPPGGDWGSANKGGWVTPPGLLPGRVAFKYFGDLPDVVNPGWGQVQVGYRWAPPGAGGANSMNGHGYPDLSIYDDFRMSIHNQQYDPYFPIKGNIWINTGYTDPQWNHNPVFAQVHWTNGGWEELGYCDWIDLVLDFDHAEVYEWDVKTGQMLYSADAAIPNLDYVTGIGFAVAYDNPGNDYPYSVDVDTIPEAASIAIWSLLGLSWLGLSVWRRRRMAGGGDRSARSSWSEENRQAIHRIIDRG